MGKYGYWCEKVVIMRVTNDIFYVGVNDHDIDLFEGQYVVPNGMAYNSYVIIDEKIAVEWINKWLKRLLKNDKNTDYLAILYMLEEWKAENE